MKISLFTVLVRVIRRAGQFCVARWRSGLPESSSSQEDWRLGKRRAILWNPIENPFGCPFQPRLGQQDKHFCGCPGPNVFDRSYPLGGCETPDAFVILVPEGNMSTWSELP